MRTIASLDGPGGSVTLMDHDRFRSSTSCSNNSTLAKFVPTIGISAFSPPATDKPALKLIASDADIAL